MLPKKSLKVISRAEQVYDFRGWLCPDPVWQPLHFPMALRDREPVHRRGGGGAGRDGDAWKYLVSQKNQFRTLFLNRKSCRDRRKRDSRGCYWEMVVSDDPVGSAGRGGPASWFGFGGGKSGNGRGTGFNSRKCPKLARHFFISP